jgi:AcrR family transcriptional regulator
MQTAQRESKRSSRSESKKEQSNRARAEATRTALIEAARELFAAKGYADTGTPEIVSAAGVTRGALYHHFVDKLELFRAVVEREAETVARHIARESEVSDSPIEGIMSGAEGYFDAMSEAGRARLLLLDGPAILGVEAIEAIDRRTGQAELRQGLEAATQRADVTIPLEALTTVFSAAFDKAALSIVLGGSREEYMEAIRVLAEGIPGMKANME